MWWTFLSLLQVSQILEQGASSYLIRFLLTISGLPHLPREQPPPRCSETWANLCAPALLPVACGKWKRQKINWVGDRVKDWPNFRDAVWVWSSDLGSCLFFPVIHKVLSGITTISKNFKFSLQHESTGGEGVVQLQRQKVYASLKRDWEKEK